MTDWNAVSAFMANVVPWPVSPQDTGYVNLHYSATDLKNPTGPLRKGMGKPFRNVDDFISRAAWHNNSASFKDQWFCLSLQKDVKHNKHDPKKPNAQRLAANALSLKSIWIDADVGSKPGEYPDVLTAVKALMTFRVAHGLPEFSALVGSGGGVHAYWISQTPLSVADWFSYANGLKALLLQDKLVKDAGITTDPARLLRVPGTFNHKTTPPKPVQLFNLPLVMYDFTTDLAHLPTFAPAGQTISTGSPKPEVQLWADGVAPFKVDPAFAGLAPDASLQGGIDKHEDVLLDPTPIFKQCGFYRDALLTGGEHYDNALWMYSVLGATFMEKGNEIAHAVSKSHSDYTKDSTQALYDRKLAERADRGIGYPSCAAIKGAGCKSCETCPLFSKGKSPLNIRPVVTAAVNPNLNMASPLQQTQSAKEMHLPAGYDLNADGIICFVVEREVNGEQLAPTMLPLFYSKLTAPWSQSNPDCINFTTTVDLGVTVPASIKHSQMNGVDLYKAFSDQRVKIYPDNKTRLEQFMVSWLAQLHAVMVSQTSLPYGWYKNNGVIEGFVFGGKNYLADGSEIACGMADPKVRSVFHPTGDIQHWFDACKLVTDRPRPDIWSIVGLSFAAPLMAIAGQNAAALCAYGQSAAGKTAAYTVGIGVWGNPAKGKQGSSSTYNSIMKMMGQLSNLPLYWDEIKKGKSQEHAFDVIFAGSEGVEKNRLMASTAFQERGTWQTAMMFASNVSFVDYVMTKTKDHLGGVARVLEYFTEELEPTKVSRSDAAVTLNKLQYSYGQIGARYAKFLALNHAQVEKDVNSELNAIEKKLDCQPYERLWVTLAGTIIVGCRYANALGCEFNIAELEAFLHATIVKNRKKAQNLMTIVGRPDSTEAIMTGFFGKVMTNDQMIWTKGMPAAGPGRPPMVSVVHGPKDTKNTQVVTGISVRWDITGRKLLVLKNELVAYLQEMGSSGSMLESLTNEYGMRYEKQVRIGSGTVFDPGRATVCVFDITPAHDWAAQMWMWTPVEERPEGFDPNPPGKKGTTIHMPFEGVVEAKLVETGFETDDTTGLATPDSVAAFVHGAKRHG